MFSLWKDFIRTFKKEKDYDERGEIVYDRYGRDTSIRRKTKDAEHYTETYIDMDGKEQHSMTRDGSHVIVGKYNPLHPDCYASGENAESRMKEQDANIGKWAVCGISRLGKIHSVRRKEVPKGDPVDPKPIYVGVGIDGTYWQSSQPKILKDDDQTVLDELIHVRSSITTEQYVAFMKKLEEKFEEPLPDDHKELDELLDGTGQVMKEFAEKRGIPLTSEKD